VLGRHDRDLGFASSTTTRGRCRPRPQSALIHAGCLGIRAGGSRLDWRRRYRSGATGALIVVPCGDRGRARPTARWEPPAGCDDPRGVPGTCRQAAPAVWSVPGRRSEGVRVVRDSTAQHGYARGRAATPPRVGQTCRSGGGGRRRERGLGESFLTRGFCPPLWTVPEGPGGAPLTWRGTARRPAAFLVS
jgi:hypothetical protein